MLNSFFNAALFNLNFVRIVSANLISFKQLIIDIKKAISVIINNVSNVIHEYKYSFVRLQPINKSNAEQDDAKDDISYNIATIVPITDRYIKAIQSSCVDLSVDSHSHLLLCTAPHTTNINTTLGKCCLKLNRKKEIVEKNNKINIVRRKCLNLRTECIEPKSV